MEKFTDEQIVKDLYEMTYGGHSCMHCKYGATKGDDRCGLQGCKIGRDALDLINRQKAEIEEFAKTIVMLDEEKKELQKCCDYFAKNLIANAKRIKAEARKEFAERLKDELGEDVIYEQYPFFGCAIDNVVKEMTEGRKEDEGK